MQAPSFPSAAPPRGAATPKIVVYLVFGVLIATIVTFITIGYLTYKEDMKVSKDPVTISMHDPAALRPTLYIAKDAADRVEKGAIIKLRRTSEPVMSATEKTAWIISGIMSLGILTGIVLAFTSLRRIGAYLAIGSVIVAIGLGCWGWYLNKHRETPYEITLQPEMKNGISPAPVTFTTDDSTTVKIDKKDESVMALKTGMKASVTFSEEGDVATKIISPIPEKPKSNVPEPKNGEIISVGPAPGAKAVMSIGEKVVWGIGGLAALVVLAGLVTVFKSGWKVGLSIAVVGAIGVVVCLEKAQSLAATRVPPYDIVLQPEVKKDKKAKPVTITTDSSTTVKIDGEEQDITALKPGMKMTATFTENNKAAATIVSPVLGKKKPALRLPAGFVGSTKRPDEPKYLDSTELKEQYLVQSFSVTRGPEIFQVSQVDREPLGFTAFARSLRLGALHDFKNSKILQEGPMMIPNINRVKWGTSENPFGTKEINAYALIVEGDDDNHVHVKCRQVAIQGDGTTMYVIKATAPASDWPAAGEVFDSAISTFEIATVPEGEAETAEANTQAASQAATRADTQPARQGATRPGVAATAPATQAGHP